MHGKSHPRYVNYLSSNKKNKDIWKNHKPAKRAKHTKGLLPDKVLDFVNTNARRITLTKCESELATSS